MNRVRARTRGTTRLARRGRRGTPQCSLGRAGPGGQSVLHLQRLGTRAVVAEALVAEAEKLDRAVRQLVDAAAGGDIAAAKALIPWLNQALGTPTERVEHRKPGSLEELEQMDTARLEALVAEGRRKRLAALPQPSPTAESENS